MADTILEVKHLKKYFNTPKGLLHAVDDVNFTLERGKTLGIVGESGCGKSTFGYTLMGLHQATSGSIYMNGIEVSKKVKVIFPEIQVIILTAYGEFVKCSEFSFDKEKCIKSIL